MLVLLTFRLLCSIINARVSRTGFYPERVLADQIYRTQDNRAYCKLRGIRLLGPKLGRLTETAKEDNKLAESKLKGEVKNVTK